MFEAQPDRNWNMRLMATSPTEFAVAELRSSPLPPLEDLGWRRFGKTALKLWQARGWHILNFTQIPGKIVAVAIVFSKLNLGTDHFFWQEPNTCLAPGSPASC